MRHVARILVMVAVLAAVPRPEAEANASSWPQGVCKDLSVTVTRVPGDPDALQMDGSSPAGSCVVSRLHHSGLPLGWVPQLGRVANFEATLEEDSIFCAIEGSTQASSSIIQITAGATTDTLMVPGGSVLHVGPSVSNASSVVKMLLVKTTTDPPTSATFIVAELTFVRSAGQACDFSGGQTWTGTIVFTDPEASDLPPE